MRYECGGGFRTYLAACSLLNWIHGFRYSVTRVMTLPSSARTNLREAGNHTPFTN
jgi:hypothetical protein